MVVLERMSFVAAPGSVVALVGASGAGKSTVGRLIERFYDPLEGGLFLDGVDFRRLELRWLRQQIGLVEQERTLAHTLTRTLSLASTLTLTLASSSRGSEPYP